jgi:hypothetical protein
MPRAKRATFANRTEADRLAIKLRAEHKLAGPKPGEKYAAQQAQKKVVNNTLADMLELFNPFRFL